MHRYQKEASQLIKLATPVLIASVAQTGMGFVDTVMAGGVSPTDMAAVAIATSVWLPSILFGIGLLMALVPVVAQLNGSSRQVKIPFEIQQGIYLSLLLSIPIVGVLFQTQQILDWMQVEALMAEKANGYMYAVMLAVPAFLLFQTLRSLTDGLSLTKPAMVIGFIGLLLNISLNWIFVYGKFGAPALGGVGCGVATTIVYWIMFGMMYFYVANAKKLRHINLFGTFHPPQWKAQLRLFKLGLPVAAALFFEVTLFAVVALLIAPLGPTTVASHQVAINFSTLVFMLPMSIGAAVSIRVGHKLGEKSTEGAKIASRVGIIVGLITACFTALMTIVFREQISLLYTDNREVVSVASALLVYAAVYQCTDSIQVIAAGALRGYKDMKAIFNRTFIAYWVLGLPAGYILGMTDWVTEPMGATGFWIGFIIGLSSAAIMLGRRLHWMHKQPDNVQLVFSSR
ncbi:MATE family efflux transporter [Vibrio penaeicida]|uniref:Multidrug resistance protein NorM n=1 Tax=Vibrio penaeicida TaxID=104609 RepID=A0AAV5NJ75_9VIBR|nr:MATE family efflux transporter [Vibrio penaeicida]RTZ23900.1 MATE family efflux transporter [Vibrio penaeicida]GLQ70648.1 multidrug resistance protein NorM [Vibrio penaeicida]